MGFNIIDLWALGYDGLSYDDLVKLENQLRFALGSVQGARSKLDAQNAAAQSGGNTIGNERTIQQSLQDTSRAIIKRGSLASWLESLTYNQKAHLQTPYVRAFFKNVQSGQHNLEPMTRGQYKSNAVDTMLWLIFEIVSLPHACLVLCSFSKSRLVEYSFGELISIVEYVAKNRASLYCEALEVGPYLLSNYQASTKKRKRTTTNAEPQRSLGFAQSPSPCSHPDLFTISSTSAIKYRLNVNQLGEIDRDFLGMISAVGGCFPSDLFAQAHNSLNWGPHGQAIWPGPGVPEGHEKTLDRLEKGGFIIPLPNNGVGIGTTIMIHPEVPKLLSCFGQIFSRKWKRLATNAVLHAYPKDPQLRPIDYTVAGALLIPILRRALSNLLECSPDGLERQTLELAIDACLSASSFGDKCWKTVAVAYAEHMADQLGCAVIKGRVHLRKATLERLYPSGAGSNLQEIKITRANNRSNADFGKLILLQARLQIERRLSSDEINTTLDQFRAFNPISDIERSVQLDINFLRAKILRYDGRFGPAREALVDFVQAVRYRASNLITIHYYETLCEAGDPPTAIVALEHEYGELLKKENGQAGYGRRLRLALAGAYLMKVLLDRSVDNDLLEKAERLFKSVQWMAEPSMVTKHNIYVTKASLGMVHLIRSEWEESLKYWDEALDAANTCFPDIGHAEMVTQYAQCEILHRIGRYSEALAKGVAAQEIFQKCGREYYFLGQGTAWLDKLDELAKRSGRPAIAGRD